MRVTKYTVELNKEKQNVLIKEEGHNYSYDALDSPLKIVAMMNSLFRMNQKAEEYLYMISFNTKMRVLGVFEISHGTVNASLVSPREIFIRALLSGATSIVLVHNHPSGDTTPSQEDLAVFRRIKDTGNLMNVELIDNIIIGEQSYYGFREEGRYRE